MYVYESPIGLFKIQRHQSNYLLIIKDIVYGQYISAEAAASDVYCHSTGCFEWDVLDCQIDDVPSDITEWQYFTQPLI
jgi:hypothetical protein